MKTVETPELEHMATEIRKDVVRMTGVARAGHLASALSIVDALVFLYWRILNVRPDEPNWPGRDRLVLGKGHGCAALYAALARKGYFDRNELWTFRRLGSMLQGHPETPRTPGVDAPSGSSGMGLGVAAGMALASRTAAADWNVYCILGDGELQEGSVWESVSFASHHGLGNLVLLIDANGLQMEGPCESIMSVEPLDDRLRSFGWDVSRGNGHSMETLGDLLSGKPERDSNKPLAVVLETVAGRGVSMAEEGRFRPAEPLDRENMEKALRELEESSRRNTGKRVSGGERP